MSTVFNIKQSNNENLKISLAILTDKSLPVDLSGVIAKCQIRVTENAEEAVFSGSSDTDDTIVITDNNIILDIPFTLISDFPIGPLYYDIVVFYAEDDADVIIEGKLNLTNGVTR